MADLSSGWKPMGFWGHMWDWVKHCPIFWWWGYRRRLRAGTRGTVGVTKPCVYCGDKTTNLQRGYVDAQLRRRRGPICDECQMQDHDGALRQERTRHDWKLTTTPVTDMLINSMGDQFPGSSRAALRAFIESDLPRATIPGVSASTLQQSIQTLGLTDEIYAEVRGDDTVIRRIEQRTEKRKKNAAGTA